MRDAALARIRLRHLQCFLAVAQFGNLRRAAQALSITQPAVTKTINELEALLSKPLFVRGRHGATLTIEGEAFMRHAGDSINALGHAVDSVLREPEAAPLRIGVLPTVAPSFLPGVLHAFAARWPLVAVRVATGRNAQLIEQLRSRELDAVIGRLSDPELMAGLSFESLYAEPMVIVLRPGHALATEAKAKTRGARAAPALTAVGAYPLVLVHTRRRCVARPRDRRLAAARRRADARRTGRPDPAHRAGNERHGAELCRRSAGAGGGRSGASETPGSITCADRSCDDKSIVARGATP